MNKKLLSKIASTTLLAALPILSSAQKLSVELSRKSVMRPPFGHLIDEGYQTESLLGLGIKNGFALGIWTASGYNLPGISDAQGVNTLDFGVCKTSDIGPINLTLAEDFWFYPINNSFDNISSARLSLKKLSPLLDNLAFTAYYQHGRTDNSNHLGFVLDASKSLLPRFSDVIDRKSFDIKATLQSCYLDGAFGDERFMHITPGLDVSYKKRGFFVKRQFSNLEKSALGFPIKNMTYFGVYVKN